MAVTLLGCHRGYSVIYPENTLLAIKETIDAGIKTIEMDVRVSSDGVLCLMHDATVDRTTDGTGNINELTWAEISALDAGSWKGESFAGERVPSLEQVLDFCNNKDVFPMIEIEYNAAYPDIANDVARMINERNMGHQCLIFCAEVTPAFKAKYLCPDAKVGISGSGSITKWLADASAFGLDFLNWDWETLSAEIVGTIQATGLKCYAWCPDTLVNMQTVIDYGVDGLLSNYADRLVSITETNSITQGNPTRTFSTVTPKVYDGNSFKTVTPKRYLNGYFNERIIKV